MTDLARGRSPELREAAHVVVPVPRSVAGDPGAPRVLGGHAMQAPRRAAWILLGLGAGAMLTVVGSLRFGAESMDLGVMVGILWQALAGNREVLEASGPAGVILLQIRLPRVLLAFLVGGALAGIGVALQALLRNPLADPYVLGISSGAALGASVAMLLGFGTAVLAFAALPFSAFLGGLLAILLVYRIAVSYGMLPVHTLLLAGVVLNAVCSALIMFITSIMAPARSYGMMAWLMGTLSVSDYRTLTVLAVYVGLGVAILLRQARALNVLTLGEEVAATLGIEVEALKRTVFFTAALLTGAVVAVSGMIGFVGMVIPHGVRLLAGADHRLLLPASVLVGGMFLTVADTIARTVLAPVELPVGIVTALVGGPVFIMLLVSRKATVLHRVGGSL